jgi:hypothetical protein
MMGKWNGFAAPIAAAAKEHHKRKENSGKALLSSSCS